MPPPAADMAETARALERAAAGAQRAAGALADAMRREDLALSALDDGAFASLALIREEARARGRAVVVASGTTPHDDARLAAEREDRVGGWLAARRVVQAWDLAPLLAAHDFDPPFLEKVAAVAGERLVAVLAWLAAGADAAGLAVVVGEETERLGELARSLVAPGR